MITVIRSDYVIAYAAFEALRETLLSSQSIERLNKPLACWAQADDRGLPLAFMNRSVRDLLDTPFDELYATHGVGHKKIVGLMNLLNRAAQAEGAEHDDETSELATEPAARSEYTALIGASDRPTEAVWEQWQATVQRSNLGHEPIGRFARSLNDLARSVWHNPLSLYTSRSLSEISLLHAHGEKRIMAILEVFGDLHRLLSNVETPNHLAVSIMPRFVGQLDAWARTTLHAHDFPDEAEVRASFIAPLVEQLRIDAGDELADWAEARLTGNSRYDANQVAASPSAFYQRKLAEIIAIRWPEGEEYARGLAAHFGGRNRAQPGWRLFEMALHMFFSRAPALLRPAPLWRSDAMFPAATATR